jgi:hypothetical protein
MERGETPLERQSQLGPSVRFGPFELNVRSAELQYNGRKILLHEQPFQGNTTPYSDGKFRLSSELDAG